MAVERMQFLFPERAQQDGGMSQVRSALDSRHREQAEPLVDLGEPLELLGHHLAEDLVDPGRPGVPLLTPGFPTTAHC